MHDTPHRLFDSIEDENRLKTDIYVSEFIEEDRSRDISSMTFNVSNIRK